MFQTEQHKDDSCHSHSSSSGSIEAAIKQVVSQKSCQGSDLLDALSLHPRLSYLLQETNGKLTMMTLYEHTECVLNQYERYFSHMSLPGGVRHDVLRIALALHDIGKPISYQMNRPQHECHLEVIDSVRDILPLSDEEVALVKSLIMHDPLGLYNQKKISGTDALNKLEEMYQSQHLSREDFFGILMYYYQSDTSGYTTSAGSIGTLDHLFFENPKTGELQYHSSEPRLLMTLDHEQQLSLLRWMFIQE